MTEPLRGSSLPPRNDEEVIQNMINPAYSGSVATNDGVHYSSSREEMVEMIKTEPERPVETPQMRRIKIFLIILFLFIIISAAFNVYHFVAWQSERSSTNVEGADSVSDFEVILDIASLYYSANATEEITEIETSTNEIPSTTTTSTTESTTTSTEPPTTTLSIREQMREAYRNYTEWYFRPYSEIGLDNYVANAKYFTDETAIFGETQFADLSKVHLRKLINSGKDPKRDDNGKRCNIHTYFNKEQGKISGSLLYGKDQRIPSRVDLRRRGIIGDVRDQGTTCNAGYAFAVTSLLESKVDSNGSRLSVQMVLADHFNHHCEGGEIFRAMESVEQDGIVTEADLPFDDTQEWHDVNVNDTRYRSGSACLLTGSHTLGSQYWDYNEDKYKYRIENVVPASLYITHFLSKVGTVVVEVPVDIFFFFYKKGIYSPTCTALLGYQPALVVGYGKRHGRNVWILRNSFGTDWGIDGDFEMDRDSNCGAFDYAFSFYDSV